MKGANKAYRFQNDVRREGRVIREETFESRLAKNLSTEGIQSSIGKGGRVRPTIDVMKTFAMYTIKKRGVNDEVESAYHETYIPIGDLVLALGRVNADRSVNAFIQVMEKIAVDDVAKKYWRDYYGEYGVALTQEFSEMLKNSGVKVGSLVKWREWFERTYGIKSAAVKVIDITIGAHKMAGKIQDTINYVIQELGVNASIDQITRFVNDLASINKAVRNQVIDYFQTGVMPENAATEATGPFRSIYTGAMKGRKDGKVQDKQSAKDKKDKSKKKAYDRASVSDEEIILSKDNLIEIYAEDEALFTEAVELGLVTKRMIQQIDQQSFGNALVSKGYISTDKEFVEEWGKLQRLMHSATVVKIGDDKFKKDVKDYLDKVSSFAYEGGTR